MPKQHQSLIEHYKNLPVAIYVSDRYDRLRAYNTAAKELLGITPREGRKNWYPTCRIYDESGKAINRYYRPVSTALKANGKSHVQELLFVLEDGSKRNILISSMALLNESLNYSGAVHTLTDVTLQRTYEGRHALLAAIIGSSEDAIISKDLNGSITSWNPAAELMFGYTAEEAIGQSIGLIIPKDRMPEELRITKQLKRGEKIAHLETVRITKAGREIPIFLTISPILDDAGRVIGASKISRDISVQKQAEESLQQYATQLEELVNARTSTLQDTIRELAEAKEEVDRVLVREKELSLMKSRFVSMASHEFRTPLSSIKLSASLISKYAEQNQKDQIVKHTEKIKRSVADLTAILGDFLSLEKLESGKVDVNLEALYLSSFATEAAEDFQIMCKPGQQIVCRHKGPVVPTRLDKQLLHNCLNNLLSNAIKYSDENTVIELQTIISPTASQLIVKDNGIGIPEADQAHLFEPFFRAHNTGAIQGTGLGLNIVARYTQLMNGQVTFESQKGKGTRFTLTFPPPLTE